MSSSKMAKLYTYSRGVCVTRLLVVDPPGSGVDISIRAQRAGHDVRLFVKRDAKTEHIGRGFVQCVDDFRPWLRWSDLVICTDNTIYLVDLERHRQEGAFVVAASPEAASWEINREKGMEVFKKAGIATIPSKTFNNYDNAIAFIKSTMKRYVSKPSGDGLADKALSYVSHSPEDMIYMLQRWKRLGKLKSPFILQEFVKGIEAGVSGYFGPHGWNSGWEENFEFKKLMNDDLGCATGEQGTVLRIVDKSKLADKVLVPLTAQLHKLNYCGDIDVNCIIDERGTAWPLEFTMRCGWPAFQLHMALCGDGDPVLWLLALAKGEDARPFIRDKIACGVVLSIPDYPYSHMTRKEVVGVPIYGIKPSLWKHIHPCEMMLADKVPVCVGDKIVDMPHPATAGDYVLVMTAIADTVRDAALTCCRRLKTLNIPNSPMWRTDIGKRLAQQLPKLQALGYAKGMQYSGTS